jgi:pyridoxine kinase
MFEQFGTPKIVLTGIHYAQNKIGTYIFQVDNELMYSHEGLANNYPGTGDIFASVLIGKLLNGCNIIESAAFASHFIHDVIEYTMKWDTPTREGVLLEACLHKLLNK